MIELQEQLNGAGGTSAAALAEELSKARDAKSKVNDKLDALEGQVRDLEGELSNTRAEHESKD